ncbi:nicotinate-nucleotide diphosphorylase (carboxylating) [Flavipsychrobacter stenotrophus]|uniref:Probable nicotinate-nucleotide pyrophosphorylase [carboxylating] n=1 Tax=Flavipsychrobacter stenotrophus TaxID=2077091 RepID=A0A2S7STX2_9BACT|nr:carboxylating nicotinate-nucleotide diphosphorylase [Flavipsychrobacter stenotrophus]PQJ10360.1 nicotinate-nucleotide diphosphorylase (carboxylating) [Flavipsychrobacter stenotrophus]
MTTTEFIAAALSEDVGAGDFSSLASIDADARGLAVLKIKEAGIIAGITLAEEIFRFLEPDVTFTAFKKDGDRVAVGEVAFEVAASVHTILKAERLSLNCMQRMSGIATLTNEYVTAIKDYPARILDTRKTTPLFRAFEKEAVLMGGGVNHRMGLYDMIMLKDNHIDFCGGIEMAIAKTNDYLKANNLDLKIEVETRTIDDVKRVMACGGVHRIMLDNYSPAQLEEAIQIIGGKYETEASGGIQLSNIVDYARTGVDYISVGAIIHHAVSMDLSLKAKTV